MLIGLTGGLAAGKSEAAQYLAKKHGFTLLVFSDVLREEAKKRGIEPTRENLQTLGIALRKETGNDAILAEKLLLLLKGKTVVDGIRNTAEIRALRRHSPFLLLAIDALPQIRFERLTSRKRPGDPTTMATFTENDKREYLGIIPAFEIGKCMRLASATIKNDFTLEHLYKAIDAVLANFSKQ